MTINRRDFLTIMGVGSVLTSIGCVPLMKPAKYLSTGISKQDLAEKVIRKLVLKGVDYADIRICIYRFQGIYSRNRSFERIEDSESSGFGIRVLYRGAWGFTAFQNIDEITMDKAADLAYDIAKSSSVLRNRKVVLTPENTYRDTWVSPFKIDPFQVSLDQKCELIMEVAEKMLAVPGISRTHVGMNFDLEEKVFASTEGSLITQKVIRSEPWYQAHATIGGDTQYRSFEAYPLNKGYEHIQECGYLENAERIAEEAVEKVKAPEGPKGVNKDLILTPSHLWLTIHESVGHPTELDRALGYEANFAGTSFATPDKLNKLQYGSKIVNFVADRTSPGARSTVAYDDEGVKTQKWDIIRKGVFSGYSMNRETASILGYPQSNGCAYADSWHSVPLIRIPNINLQPTGMHSPTLDDFIADTRDGILIDGSGSYSIDQQRRNFQFGGNAFWEIRNGKRTRMLKNVIYHAMTSDFWNACDAIGCQDEFRLYGTRHCGKGEPGQAGQMSTGAPPARFRQIEVGANKS